MRTTASHAFSLLQLPQLRYHEYHLMIFLFNIIEAYERNETIFIMIVLCLKLIKTQVFLLLLANPEERADEACDEDGRPLRPLR